MSRELLDCDRTYYVRTDGDDGHDGLHDSAGGAFSTWQRALDVVAALDLNRHDVTICHGAEADSRTFTVPSFVPPLSGGGKLHLAGSPTAGGTVFDTPGADCFYLDRTGDVLFRDMTLRGGGAGLLQATYGSRIWVTDGVVFGPAPFAHVYVHDGQSMALLLGASYAIAGGAGYHLFVNGGMAFLEASTVSISGAPAFPGGFVCAINGGKIQTVTTTFTGAVHGPRYAAIAGGVVNTCLAGVVGPGYFPGDAPGSTSAGGQYL